jgi:hypothetical protein
MSTVRTQWTEFPLRIEGRRLATTDDPAMAVRQFLRLEPALEPDKASLPLDRPTALVGRGASVGRVLEAIRTRVELLLNARGFPIVHVGVERASRSPLRLGWLTIRGLPDWTLRYSIDRAGDLFSADDPAIQSASILRP